MRNLKFTDLHHDCVYLIFDHLNFHELLNIAEICPEFAYIASYVFHHKYSNHEVRIEETKCADSEIPCHISESTVQIRDFGIASKIMKYFGNKIRKFSIWNQSKHNYTSGSEWTKLNRMANELVSQTVTQLNLGTVSKELLPFFTAPFKKVEKLSLEIEAETGGMKLNELCPSVKELRIRLKNNVDYDFIDCKLPYLKHLEILYSGNRKEQVIGLIEKNPQICSVVVLWHTTVEFIYWINEILLNLETLEFRYNGPHKPLHFESVKHCTLEVSPSYTLENLSFSQLKSLEATFGRGDLGKFTEFFRRHTNLERLNLTRIWNTVLPLEQLTSELVDLKELTLACGSGINVDDVTTFIEKHPKLMKFQFTSREIPRADRQILIDRFSQDWHIGGVPGDMYGFLFEKKKNL